MARDSIKANPNAIMPTARRILDCIRHLVSVCRAIQVAPPKSSRILSRDIVSPPCALLVQLDDVQEQPEPGDETYSAEKEVNYRLVAESSPPSLGLHHGRDTFREVGDPEKD